MYSSHRYKNLTYLCGTANDSVSCMSVQGRQRKICGKQGLLLLMVPCLRQSNVYIKRKLRVLRLQKCIPLVGAKTSLTCARLQTTPSQVSQYRAANGNFRKFGSTISHGTVCAPKQCLYQKEATGIETPKMYSSRRCKNLTCAELQTTPSHVCQYRAENEICGNPGLPVPMVPCLHQSNVYIKRKLRVW